MSVNINDWASSASEVFNIKKLYNIIDNIYKNGEQSDESIHLIRKKSDKIYEILTPIEYIEGKPAITGLVSLFTLSENNLSVSLDSPTKVLIIEEWEKGVVLRKIPHDVSNALRTYAESIN